MSSKIQKYDVVIIGDEFSALLLAQKLATNGRHVALVPNKESLEDFRKDHNERAVGTHEPFQYAPMNSEAEELFSWLEEEYFPQQKLHGDLCDTPPVTFEGGQFKTFLGFGERKLKSIDALQYYLSSQSVYLKEPIQGLVDQLLKEPSFDILDKMTVTSFEVEDKNLASVTLNGSTPLKADQFIFCSSPKELLTLFNDASFGGRQRQKLAKSKLWTRVNLVFHYTDTFEHQPGIHILMGTKDDFEPLVGEFQETPKGFVSTWTYLLDQEQSEDPEIMGGIIKYMKRQLKRAYPDSFNFIDSEKIKVHTDTHGQIEALFDSWTPKNVNNLFVASPQLSPFSGVLANLERAQSLLLELLGPQDKLVQRKATSTASLPELNLN